ncbi:CDP-diacylglycerol--glycerol-3-phosphate 3-phosphatidyltransferase 2 [Ziziphus jujuba]|uniref:CDP-diacylglycerol--glycerol-3-phosphate 3-phosphatidyltransferase 2 n=1 Tax=Ziziphus jujuba TaxID=326968 RepID=A0A6P3ZUG6_ZIZJJ|nr:CDP-diacylglycerol--glycerol-3-phosphate 3-phosphatidyltransferase 2 [Ziziphus jujuba]
MVLKLSTAAPIKARKWVWIRPVSSASRKPTRSTNTTTFTTTKLTKANNKTSSAFYLSQYTTYHPNPKPNHRILSPPIYNNLGWCMITPCAPFEHDKGGSLPNLGFTFPPLHHHHLHRHHHRHSSFSVPSSSSESSSSSSSSDSPPSAEDTGGGFVADMGSESKGQDWYGNGLCQNHNQTISPLQHHHHQQQNSSKLLTLPTILTLGRVAAVPLLISTFYVDSWWGTTATTSIFIAAAITDWLDGYIARKMRLGSAFGAFLDPVADKLMVAATLVLLCTKPFNAGVFGQVPWLLTVPAIAIIGREITMSAVREWAASQNGKLLEAVAVNNLGKWKTATQMTALTILLATRDSSLGGPGILVATGVVLLYISAGLAVWSLIVYMSKIWRVLLK